MVTRNGQLLKTKRLQHFQCEIILPSYLSCPLWIYSGKHVLVFRPYLSYICVRQMKDNICLAFVLFDRQTNIIAYLSYIYLVDKCGQIHYFHPW